MELLCDDVTYRMPVRLNSSHNSERPDYSESSDIFSDSLASLKVRVDKLRTNYAWAESPASRTRHFVSNIRVRASSRAGELAVSSYILVYRNRGTAPEADVFSGERQDVLRHVDGAWRLASRFILLDQAVIGANNISILF